MKNFKKVVVMFLFLCSVFLTKNVFAEETTFETVDETQVNSLYIEETQGDSDLRRMDSEALATIIFEEAMGTALTENQDTESTKSTGEESEEVITDQTLKKIALEHLHLPEDTRLTKDIVEKIETLYLFSDEAYQITSLEGLQYAKNMTHFCLSESQVTDFSPLEHLTKLKSVTIMGTSLTDHNFPDLTKNPDLFFLDVARTSLTNASLPMIVQNKNLEDMRFDYNSRISDIRPLAALPKLRSLGVQFCSVQDFTAISSFPSLINLSAYGQKIKPSSEEPSLLSKSDLTYEKKEESLFIPFDLMPNRLTNFDGYLPPFTTSTKKEDTQLFFDDEPVAAENLLISSEGITVKNVSEETFNNLETMVYQAKIDNPAGTYAVPTGYRTYSISNGEYEHTFKLLDLVTVRYQDTEGNDLLNENGIPYTEYLSGSLGAAFQAEQKNIPGYTFSHVIGNPNGIFKDEPQEITFVYTKENAVIHGEVLVLYRDKEENILHSLSVKGKVGDAYQTTAKEFEGYKLSHVEGAEQGAFAHHVQTTVYVYEKVTAKDEPKPGQPSDAQTSPTTASDGKDNQQATIPLLGTVTEHLYVYLGCMFLLIAILLNKYARKN
jgi:Leucine-rich repeat (LRR) protein